MSALNEVHTSASCHGCRKQIQEALNKQTYHQFLAYAQQTLPGQPQKVG